MNIKKADLKKSISILKKEVSGKKPVVYIITGSGQQKMAEYFENLGSISFSKLPGFAEPTVKGHSGKIYNCIYRGCSFFIQCGRTHLYEKNRDEDLLFPIKVVKGLGISRLLLLNAAGAVSRKLKAGNVMIISDHINLMCRNPLFGKKPNADGIPFLPMRPAYDPEFIKYIQRKTKKSKQWKTGIYAGVMGPVYETEAELNMLEKFGADVVGMSTVQETIYARFLGLKVSAVSLISNDRYAHADHEAVVKQSEKGLKDIVKIIKAYIEHI